MGGIRKVEGVKTRNGKPVWVDELNYGDEYSEKTQSFTYGDGYIVTPTINPETGDRYDIPSLMDYYKENGPYDPYTGEKLPVFQEMNTAEEYSKWRSENILNFDLTDQEFYTGESGEYFKQDGSEVTWDDRKQDAIDYAASARDSVYGFFGIPTDDEETGMNTGGLASRPIDPVMEVDGGFLVLTPEKHDDGAPVWKFIPEDVPVPRTSIRPKLRPEMSEEEMRQAFYETKDEMVKQAAIEAGLAEPEEFAQNEYALGGLAVARKGIETEEGYEMANKKFQLDEDKADLNNDEELSSYEKARAEAIQKAQVADDPELDEKMGMYHGGMMEPVDPVSGNPIPIGSTAEEVRDDIDISISQGEYVLPADVVKWHGLEKIMMMQEEAKMGLMAMDAMGLIPAVEAEEPEGEVCPKCDGEGCDHCGGTGYHTEEEETPEGNEVEEATVEVSEEEPEVRETEEYEESDYSKKTSMYGMVKKPKVTFIV